MNTETSGLVQSPGCVEHPEIRPLGECLACDDLRDPSQVLEAAQQEVRERQSGRVQAYDEDDIAVAERALVRWQAGGPLVDPVEDLLTAPARAPELGAGPA